MKTKSAVLLLLIAGIWAGPACGQFTDRQLSNWLKRFPDADANGDGRLTAKEANAYRQKMQSPKTSGDNRGVRRQFKVDPGWQAEQFPQHAVCYKSPKEIAAIFAAGGGSRNPITSYQKPSDGSLRIVATGHSFMGPGFKTFPVIAKAAGLDQPPLLTHTGGGMTGSARYKWEQENGIFQFDGNPTPKLLASIANSKWDAMMWGPYFNDHPDYYACWIDFCLKYNPDMKFYLSDAWPQLDQLDKIPASEAAALTPETFDRLGQEKYAIYSKLINSLNEEYPNKVFVLPTCDAMVLAVDYYHRGELPGVEGIHAIVGKKERSLWRDRLGHLGPGLDRLEGYVFYAAMYGRSPELINGEIRFDAAQNFPGPKLDRAFRKIAWQAVLRNPLTGVIDKNKNGIGDDQE